MFNIPPKIFIYNGTRTNNIDMGEIASYLKKKIKTADVELRKDFIEHHIPIPVQKKTDRFCERLAGIRIKDVKVRTRFPALPVEIEYEKRRITDPHCKSFGVLYDGFELSGIFSEFIPKNEHRFCHIAFTNQLLCTWDEKDKRYHLRTSIYGFPSLISTPGVIEAPARPREFYVKQGLGVDILDLKREFKGRFLDYDDKRLTEIMKGFIIQSLFYHVTGEPFCENTDCRLYNAHWQEELIRTQTKGEFCRRHKKTSSVKASPP